MAAKYNMSAKKLASAAKWAPVNPTRNSPLAAAAAGHVGAAAASSAPATTSAAGSGMPLDPSYEADINSANRIREQTLLQLQAQRAALGSTYGFGVRADGSVYDDPSNPWSRAAVMQASYDRNKAGSATSFAARGQLYSGANQTEQDFITKNNQQDRDALIRQFLSANDSITQGELTANNNSLSAGERARADAINRALAARPDAASVAPYVSSSIPGYPRNNKLAAPVRAAVKAAKWKVK